MEGRALRGRRVKNSIRRRGAPPPVPVMAMAWPTAVRLHRESDHVAIADVALPFASAFAAVRQ